MPLGVAAIAAVVNEIWWRGEVRPAALVAWREAILDDRRHEMARGLRADA